MMSILTLLGVAGGPVATATASATVSRSGATGGSNNGSEALFFFAVLLVLVVVVFFAVRRRYKKAMATPPVKGAETAVPAEGEAESEASASIVQRLRKPMLWAALAGVGLAFFIPNAPLLMYIILPVVCMIAVMVFTLVRSKPKPDPQGAPAPANMQGYLEFGKSKVQIHKPGEIETRFSDVAGIDEAMDDIREIVDFIQDPAVFAEMGARIPRGVLFMGPPGCGKTLLARAVAGEAQATFLEIGGTEFAEMFVGVGASRVRDLFAVARQNAPAIVFIDEIDAAGHGATDGGKESEDTLRQLLREMDGFSKDATAVVVIGATNAPQLLDPALTRAGRFDRKVVINRPDVVGRLAILQVHLRGKPVAEKRFWGQFLGKGSGDPIRLQEDIRGVTGATISSKGITNGIRKLVHIFAMYYAAEGGAE